MEQGIKYNFPTFTAGDISSAFSLELYSAKGNFKKCTFSFLSYQRPRFKTLEPELLSQTIQRTTMQILWCAKEISKVVCIARKGRGAEI